MGRFGFVPARAPLALVCLVSLSGCGAPDITSLDGPQGRSEEATDWPCYNPKPGHPTRAEKTGWIDLAAPHAVEAERLHGVPAAAILAMTANEGGYGWTRTAIHAANVFGWKWTSSAGAGGRGYYVLACQPSWDPGNRYVKFADARDAILFVSSRLAQKDDPWANYKAVTDRYRADRAAGVDPRTAVNRWIDGIADAGYNYDPPTYKRVIKYVANDYMDPGPNRSATYDLYRYSEGVSANVWVSIDSPAAGSAVAGNVPFVASAGGGTVTSIRFWSRPASGGDWYLLRTDDTAPYGGTWVTAPYVPDGDYQLRVEAYDGATKRATGIIAVTVDNG